MLLAVPCRVWYDKKEKEKKRKKTFNSTLNTTPCRRTAPSI